MQFTIFQKAYDFLNSEKEFVILDIVLQETITVIKSKIGLEAARKAYEFLSHYQLLTILDITAQESQDCFDFMLSANKLSFIDAALIIVARSRWYTVLSFDKEVMRLA